MDTPGNSSHVTRRRVLGLCAGSVALAGCLTSGEEPAGSDGSDGGPTETSTSPTPSPAEEVLAPPVAGDPDADVTVEVYEDYACGHCANYSTEGFPELASSYIDDGTIRYEHRDLPFLGDGSWVAASAAREVQAREGAKSFYDYSKSIFENYTKVSSGAADLTASLAESQGLDQDAIRAAGVNIIHEKTLQRDLQRGKDLGVEGTPTFVVNGEIVASGYGPSTIDKLSTAIDQHL